MLEIPHQDERNSDVHYDSLRKRGEDGPEQALTGGCKRKHREDLARELVERGDACETGDLGGDVGLEDEDDEAGDNEHAREDPVLLAEGPDAADR